MGRSELHYAAMEGDVVRARALLESDSDPNQADKRGLTPLHFAAIHEQPEAAQLLITAGARVDLRDAWGHQPLSRAVMASTGDCRMIEVLLDAGADPDHRNRDGNSARQTANRIGNYVVERCFE